MSEIQDIDQIGQAAANLQIEQPPPTGAAAEILAAVSDARADLPPHEPEITSTTYPEGTTALEAIRQSDEDEGLFDASAYVAVPEIHGQATDKIVIAFSGSVAYDASDEEGAALYESLRLGKAIELRVAGVVKGKAGDYKVTARDEEVVTGKATIKVDTLYLLTPEQL